MGDKREQGTLWKGTNPAVGVTVRRISRGLELSHIYAAAGQSQTGGGLAVDSQVEEIATGM